MNASAASEKILSRIRRFIDEHRQAKLRRKLRRTIAKDGAVRPSLHLICTGPDVDPRKLTRAELFLDEETIDAYYQQRSRLIGAIDPRWGSRFSRSVALRLAEKCGARLEKAAGIDRTTAARAWFFGIWTEVCVLVPARHLARWLAKRAKGDLIILPLPSLTVRYLGFWQLRNELEPLYLAAELRRAGANVAFLLQQTGDQRRSEDDDESTLKVVPHSNCCPWTTAAEPTSGDLPMSLLVTGGLRGLTRVKDYCPDALLVESTYAATPGPFDVGLLPPDGTRPEIWTRRFQERLSFDDRGIRLLRGEALPSDIVTELARAVRDVTERAFARACDIVDRLDVRELHICDHAFFESALLAEATRRHGGRVSVWPHSSNAVHVETRQSEQLDRVTCITRAAGETWERRRPDLSCMIDSSFMLRAPTGPRCVAPGKPLTVVVIGGAHSLSRMPLMDHIGHRSTYRSLFAALSTLASDLHVIFKPKGHWESAAWLTKVTDDVSFVRFTDELPIAIEAPNMIFVTVSHASTALLEGLGRGVPCMVAREIDVEDYVSIDPSAIPIADAATICAKIADCRDPLVFNALLEQQLAWYASETCFPPERSAQPAPIQDSTERQ